MLRFPCPHCKAVLRASDEKAGSKTLCPRCKQMLAVSQPPPDRDALRVWAELAGGTVSDSPDGQKPARPARPAPWWKSRWAGAGGVLGALLLALISAMLVGARPPAGPRPQQAQRPEEKADVVAPQQAPAPPPSVKAPPKETPKPARVSPPAPLLVRPPEKLKAEDKKAPLLPRSSAPMRADLKDPTPEMFSKPRIDPIRYLRVAFHPAKHRFGISLVRPGGGAEKKLTYSTVGETNNTCLLIDGKPALFRGEQPFIEKYQKGEVLGWKSTRVFLPQNIEVTQDVRLCRGEQTRKLDTCLIRYTLTNKDRRRHVVGLRFLLDTYIGSNDGVPFTISGRPGLCRTWFDARRAADVPDYLQVLERPNLKEPGTVAHLGLRLPETGRELDAPDRLMLTHWPGRDAGWAVPLRSFRKLPPEIVRKLWRQLRIRPAQIRGYKGDSAVVIYWNAKALLPGQTRRVGFSYGLGGVSGRESGGRLALSVGGTFRAGREFTVVAYVDKPGQGETVSLKLPAGLRLVAPASAKQPVIASMHHPLTQVSWRVKAARAGTFKLSAKLRNGVSQTKDIFIYPERALLP